LSLGRIAATVGVLSALAIVYFSHEARMAMETWRGNWCGMASAHAESRLYAVGSLQVVPFVCCWSAWYAKVGLAVSRTSLLVAVGGWLVYMLSS
jgi:hypothetical protein